MDLKQNKFTILVNSSDGFEDCWIPFFKLLKDNWITKDIPIILNTEFKEFKQKDLEIVSSCVNKNTNRKLTWSECLIKSLDLVNTPLVLYLQEDYFIERSVNSALINELAQLMIENNEIKYIGLTDSGNYPPFEDWADNRLLKVSKNSKYRISTQAALWNKDTLKSYLKPLENGWMFEIFGSMRAKKRNELFLTLNRSIYSYNVNPVIAYIHTGIIKGKWHKDIPSVFEKFNIKIDFSKRGFYKEKSWLIRKFETVKKLLSNYRALYEGILGK